MDLENATKRVNKGDKILIILDDVWETLNLEELCIPCGKNYMNCKILLTSRSEKVCQKMNAQSKICVHSLPIKEAWILFKRVVGERLEMDSNLKPVALEVVKECGGLPLLIQAVGNALKDESIESWDSALTQLQKHAPLDIDDEVRKSFNHLKLSYDYLKSEEAKSCFLLCSLWGEDEDIILEDLVVYAMGLEMFDDLDSVEDARCRFQNAVNILTSSGLLLNSKLERFTKMHDVVRDVALLIASQGNNKFLVKAGQGLTEWLPRNKSLESYTAISLKANRIIKLPDYKVNLPHLEIFIVDSNINLSMISDEFIGCMKNVKVFDIAWNDISSLPQSFELLTKLRTLDLRGNESLHEISILGKLKILEILILNRTGITEIPKEISELVNLRVLAVRDCKSLSCIAHGVIPALWRLEELFLDLCHMSEGVNSCIVEVMKLSKLTCLDLAVSSFDLFPEDFNSGHLKVLVIQIGDFYRSDELGKSGWDEPRMLGCYLYISSEHLGNPLVKWLKKLIEGRRPNTILFGIKNLKSIMPTLYHQGFNKLEHIKLNNCPNVSCLVDDGTPCDGDEGKTQKKFFKKLKHLKLWNLVNLKVLWKCPDEYTSLTNLVSLSISGCHKLERVFTMSVAQGLVNLKELEIHSCSSLEEVIWGGSGGGGDDEFGNVIVLPSLAEIYFDDLDELKMFFNSAGNDCIEYPALVEVKINGCKKMGTWGPGMHETPKLKTLIRGDNVQVVDGHCAINEALAKSCRMWRLMIDDE